MIVTHPALTENAHNFICIGVIIVIINRSDQFDADRLKRYQTQVHVYLQSSVGSRMPPFDRAISSCGTLTSWACISQRAI